MKSLSQVYHGSRDRVRPYSLVIRYGTRAGVARDTLEVILRAVSDFTTEQGAVEARQRVREDLRPYVDISTFHGYV